MLTFSPHEEATTKLEGFSLTEETLSAKATNKRIKGEEE